MGAFYLWMEKEKRLFIQAIYDMGTSSPTTRPPFTMVLNSKWKTLFVLLISVINSTEFLWKVMFVWQPKPLIYEEGLFFFNLSHKIPFGKFTFWTRWSDDAAKFASIGADKIDKNK